MRKIRKLGLFGIMGVVICALILIGISSLDANSIGEKPDKPPGKPDKPPKPPKPGEPEATWAVQIPGTNLNLKGMHDDGSPYVYANNNDDIIVSVERKGWRAAGESGIYYILLFKLVNPTTKYVEFSDVLLTVSSQYEENRCVFAGDLGFDVPGCMQYFLNHYHHPYSNPDLNSEDYDHVYIKFWIWRYDIEAMIHGDTYQLGTSSTSDRIRIKTSYTPVNTCFREEPSYHDIICQKYADDGLLNIFIEKRGDNKWHIYGNVSDLPVNESYCIEKKDKGWVSETVTTLKTLGNFSFMMDWIKNPQ